MADGDRSDKQSSYDWRQPGKARDIFVATANVMPIAFTGTSANVMAMTRPPWASGTVPSRDDATRDDRPWSYATMLKLNVCGPKTSGTWLAAAYGWHVGPIRSSTVAELNLLSGAWNIEATNRSTKGLPLQLTLSARAHEWMLPTEGRLDLDCMLPRSTVTVSAGCALGREQCAVQLLQAVSDRLFLGGELAYSRHTLTDGPSVAVAGWRPALMAKYNGTNFTLSGKAWPTVGRAVKVSYYHHLTDLVQTGAMVTVDTAARSLIVGRIAFRALHPQGYAVFRAAVGTDGMFNSLVEKRYRNCLSASFSAFVNHRFDNYGFGIGLSFE